MDARLRSALQDTGAAHEPRGQCGACWHRAGAWHRETDFIDMDALARSAWGGGTVLRRFQELCSGARHRTVDRRRNRWRWWLRRHSAPQSRLPGALDETMAGAGSPGARSGPAARLLVPVHLQRRGLRRLETLHRRWAQAQAHGGQPGLPDSGSRPMRRRQAAEHREHLRRRTGWLPARLRHVPVGAGYDPQSRHPNRAEAAGMATRRERPVEDISPAGWAYGFGDTKGFYYAPHDRIYFRGLC